ncbi:MAG: hypothetical protein IJW32_01980 [Clostridia bacterium]|nr:hypothetical protein [Clostridia bacterium]
MENIELLKISLKEQKCKNKKLKIQLDLCKCELEMCQSNNKCLKENNNYLLEKYKEISLENDNLKLIIKKAGVV